MAMHPDPMFPPFRDLSGAAFIITRLTVARGSGLSLRSRNERLAGAALRLTTLGLLPGHRCA